MLKLCPNCGKLHELAKRCEKGRVNRDTPERRLRSRYAWAQKSREIRERSRFLCAVCLEEGVYTYNELEVHHIEKVHEREDLLLEDENLICLCTKHHKEADAGIIDATWLRSLAEKRDGLIPPTL